MKNLLALVVASAIVLSGSAFAQDKKDAMMSKKAPMMAKGHMEKAHMKKKRRHTMKGHMMKKKSHMMKMDGKKGGMMKMGG